MSMNSTAQTLTPRSDICEPQAIDDWTFNGASTRELTHCYHDYPGRMIPQIAGKLLDTFAPTANVLFDPYCGSGTSLVEGMARGIKVIGNDLNPLAHLIARAKTSTPDLQTLDRQLTDFLSFLRQARSELRAPTKLAGISRLEFWFKPEVTAKLSHIKSFIERITDEPLKLFFQVAFSETARESSNTRNEEFKLYRYDPERLEKFDPDVYGIMLAKLRRNREGLTQFLSALEKTSRRPIARVCGFNTVVGIPTEQLPPSSADIVITSPPYGDSHTTVAYGQYSRLSAAWLGLSEPEKVDSKLMGGKIREETTPLPSLSLAVALNDIRQRDQKRAREVATFYHDLFRSISHVAKTLQAGGYACYVVGNRKVKGVTLPTDEAVRDFFEQFDFEYVDTFRRSIPNKRMPLRNSPTNAPGAVDNTMTREYIVVMRRR